MLQAYSLTPVLLSMAEGPAAPLTSQHKSSVIDTISSQSPLTSCIVKTPQKHKSNLVAKQCGLTHIDDSVPAARADSIQR